MCSKHIFREFDGKSFEAFESPWDTNYFGVMSAKVILKDSIRENESNALMNFLSNFDFVTITNLDNNKENNYWLGQNMGMYLADINVQFIKDLSEENVESETPAEVFEAYQHDDRVLKIAHCAFKYSRFFNDPNLPPVKAKGIYAHWAENAFGKPGRYYILAKNQGEISGFLLFSINKNASLGAIELLAVDEEHSGFRVGRSLIAGLENFMKQKGIEHIKVGTQADNSSAIRFYTSCGFNQQMCNSIYHFWPKISGNKGCSERKSYNG